MSDPIFCSKHPQTATRLTCGRCETPICPQCMVHSPVGARCMECAQLKQLPTFEVSRGYMTRAILAGNNSDHPRLIHLASGETVSTGDRIITSGHGGAFPPGLPVGQVASVNDGGISVHPFVRRDRLEVVRLLDFGMAGIVALPKLDAYPKSNSKAGDHKGARARKP